jgi:AbrB family looped-hinge helix DNA binding protein
MARARKDECCAIEAVVTVDERGQMVLPKSVRQKMGIKPGDKLAVVVVTRGGELCCVTLLPAEKLSGTVRVLIGPAAQAGA